MRRPIIDPDYWLSKIEALKPGDLCDVKSGTDYRWYPGIVEVNGGAGYWRVRVPEHDLKSRLYRHLVAEAQRIGRFAPPPGMMEAIAALPKVALVMRLAPEIKLPIIDAASRVRDEDDVWSPYIEHVRCRGQVDAWPPYGSGTPSKSEPFEDEVWAAIWGATSA